MRKRGLAVEEPTCRERSRLMELYFQAIVALDSRNKAFLNAALPSNASADFEEVWGEGESIRRRCEELRRQLQQACESNIRSQLCCRLDGRESARAAEHAAENGIGRNLST